MVSTDFAAASNTLESMSQSATNSTLGWPVISLMWSLPRPRRPIVAIRMVSLGLPKTVVDAAAAAAVVIKKFRRSIGFLYRYLMVTLSHGPQPHGGSPPRSLPPGPSASPAPRESPRRCAASPDRKSVV